MTSNLSRRDRMIAAVGGVIALYALAGGIWFMSQEQAWKAAAKKYDTAAKKYVRVTAPGAGLKYVPTAEDPATAAATVVVNAGRERASESAVELFFAPRASAPSIGFADMTGGKPSVTETSGDWVRIDDGRRAGWTRKENLK